MNILYAMQDVLVGSHYNHQTKRSSPFTPRYRRWLSYIIILGSFILISLPFMSPIIRKWLPLLLVLFCGFTYVGWLIRDTQAISTALLCTLITFFLGLPGIALMWPLHLVLALTCYGILVRLHPALRGSAYWFRFGLLNRNIIFLIVGAVMLSSLALVAWYKLSHPLISDLQSRIPLVPFWLLPLLGIAFSLINAAAEEMVYRGVLFAGLKSLFGPSWVVILIQAIAFGCAHLYGFPRGLMGVFLATFFGVMMGVLRHYSQGVFAPWLAHVFADLTIFAILAYFAV